MCCWGFQGYFSLFLDRQTGEGNQKTLPQYSSALSGEKINDDITRDESGMYKITSHGIFKQNSRDSEKRGVYVSAFFGFGKVFDRFFFHYIQIINHKGQLVILQVLISIFFHLVKKPLFQKFLLYFCLSSSHDRQLWCQKPNNKTLLRRLINGLVEGTQPHCCAMQQYKKKDFFSLLVVCRGNGCKSSMQHFLSCQTP